MSASTLIIVAAVVVCLLVVFVTASYAFYSYNRKRVERLLIGGNPDADFDPNNPSYTFIQGMDAMPLGMKLGPGSFYAPKADLAASLQQCNADPTCKGFSTDGGLKKTFQPVTYTIMGSSAALPSLNYAVREPDRGLFVKNDAAAHKSGYVFVQGLNVMDAAANIGTQLTDLTDNVPELQKRCNETPNCWAFNTNGVLKSKLTPNATWTADPTKGLYIRGDPVNYEWAQGMDSAAPVIAQYTASTASGANPFMEYKKRCNRDPNCKIVNTSGQARGSVFPMRRISESPYIGSFIKQ